VNSAAFAGERTIATDANAAADEAMKAARELPLHESSQKMNAPV